MGIPVESNTKNYIMTNPLLLLALPLHAIFIICLFGTLAAWPLACRGSPWVKLNAPGFNESENSLKFPRDGDSS